MRDTQTILHKEWTNNWENEILQKSKLRSYILFKEEYFSENYVNYCIPHQER